MRRSINVLFSGVLSIGVSSVFGVGEGVVRESVSLEGEHIVQAFNKFSVKLHQDFGIIFPTDESMGGVLRFRKGLIRHLKEQETLKKRLNELEAILVEKSKAEHTESHSRGEVADFCRVSDELAPNGAQDDADDVSVIDD